MQTEVDEITPVLKWAGGKRALLPSLLPRVPRTLRTYAEPFAGGAALFFALASEVLAGERAVKSFVLCDANPELANLYRVLRSNVDALIAELQQGDMEQAWLDADWLKLANEQSVRFWSYVADRPEVGCWIWTGGKDKDGYGRFAVTAPRGVAPKQRHFRAHRLSWSMSNGRLMANEMVVRHSCDTPACVRPDHVEPGTQKQNRRDCIDRGREPMGEKKSQSKLTEDNVREIRRLYATNEYSHNQLAVSFGVSQAAIGFVVRRVRWKHVE